MIRFGLDSTSEVPATAHHAVGSTVALRYLSRYTPKVVTRAELEHYRKAGIDLVLVFEDDGRPDRHGYVGGKADAEFAVKQATDILGTPTMSPCIRFAADYDPAGHPEATDAYYDGVATVIPRERCGPYGGKEVVSRQGDRGFKTLWQTYAWSGGWCDARATVQQYSNGHTVGGVGVDYNHILGVDFGQWDRHEAKPATPLHYSWFPTGPFAWKGRLLHERATVQEYDKLRRHAHLHQLRLHTLRGQLKDLADRVYFEAHRGRENGAFVLPPTWNAFHRGWRYQQLIRRAQGERIA